MYLSQYVKKKYFFKKLQCFAPLSNFQVLLFTIKLKFSTQMRLLPTFELVKSEIIKMIMKLPLQGSQKFTNAVIHRELSEIQDEKN